MYIHLTTHSAFSLQEGLLQPAEIVKAAQAMNMRSIGLTDHHLLTGSIEFVSACIQSGIQPVLGLEIDLHGGRLVLLAMSMEGWSNLCRLSSLLALREGSDAACSLDMLSRYSGDLIALSTHQLEDLQLIFPDRLYVAVQQPSDARRLSEVALKLGLPLVVTHPVYYLRPEQAVLQRTLTAIRLNRQINDLPVDALAPQGSYFATPQEIETRFKDFPGALAATEEIAGRCHFDLPIGQAHMPTVPLPPGLSAPQFLREKAISGAKNLYGDITPAIKNRLDQELEVIEGMGFEPVFLIVEEIMSYARRTGVPFSSRGSAASSLVAHCLGITSPDPMRLNLYFERFLNPARTTLPDIDTDLCSRRRDAVIQHVFDVYGAERVAMVGTINRFRPRSALGDAAKAHGVEPVKIREMVNQLPYAFWARLEEGQDPQSPFSELRMSYPSYQRVFEDAEAILKLPRHLSVHAGGLIVAPGKLTDLVPVMRSGSKGIIITQFDLDSVEMMGLVKIDLLGIRGLTVLGDVGEFITQAQPELYANLVTALDAIPSDDERTARRVENGLTIGCFNIESPGMRSTLREIHARSEDDIMAALALYRPGPLTGGLKDAFVQRFKGEQPVHHLHSALAPLLDETFGVILYQEQVLRIAHELSGFSLAEADLLRRAMSHFDPGKRMQELQRKFVDQAQARSGVPIEVGERVWEMMAAFAGYGFPKAHAASYAKVAWRSAWCKEYFPAEFMAAVLANWGGYYSQRVYLSEVRRMGLAVRPPHVNWSRTNFLVRNGVLYMGLDQVKNLTRRTIERIIQYAPFSSLDEFLSRVDPRSQEAVSLARIGGFEGFGTIPAILRRLTDGWQAGQMSLFGWESIDEDWTLEQKVDAQMELLDVSLEAHPLELAAAHISASGAVTSVDAVSRIGRRVSVAGIRQTSHRSRTAKGEPMLFLSMEDLTGTLDVIVFPNVYRTAKDLLNSRSPFLVTGIIEMDSSRGEPYLRAERVVKLG
ncbi:MAG: DNA polymerase III subunit alpha [Anaerolineales bacterium]|nr:DNA polymerase III subunit alpha [Anaerolineales bacterium]